VFLECCKYKIPLRGILHDISKFYPSEWFSYVQWFCEKPDAIDYPEEFKIVKKRFQLAWLKHQRRNKHHWQWWLLQNQDDVIALEMPVTYILEMIADWKGTSRAINGFDNSMEWYKSNRQKMILAPNTKQFIEKLLIMEMNVKKYQRKY
jgi:hypothetical protein